MKHTGYARLLAGGLTIGAMGGAMAGTPSGSAAAWWKTVTILADDNMEGRLTGSAGYDRAAAVVVAEFRRIGLAPAGTRGFYQPVDFVEQTVAMDRSSAALVGADGSKTPLAIPQDLYFRGSHAMPASFDAPLVFAGYGLSIPRYGHDDFAGLDVKGKIVVVLSGGPADIPGSVKSAARSDRPRLLAQRGAVGVIALTTPKQVEIPWARQLALSGRPSMYLADPASRQVSGNFLAATFAPDRSGLLFAGSGHDFAELAALSDKSSPLPRFDLQWRVAGSIAINTRPVRSANLVAKLPGRDPKLRAQHVVLSAHLDGLGINEPIDGDAIYNGALDNAAGVANVIAIARDLKRRRIGPKRSILFLVPTAEEVGLLGSSHFAQHPTVPRKSIVADVNFDMPLPIFPLRSVTPIGFEESTLGDAAAAVSAKMGLPIVPDPFPDRNVFIRSDQYSFIRAGVPSLFIKFGFSAGTPEAELERNWRARYYHSPRDDTRQPVQPEEAVRLNDWTRALLLRIANDPVVPAWRPTSQFAK